MRPFSISLTLRWVFIYLGQEDDVFLKHLEKNMLSQLKLRGIPDVNKVFLREDAKKSMG